MRALLVNPWIYDFASYDLWSKPLGLLTIAAYLKKLGCELDLVDCLDRFHPALKNKNSRFGDGNYCYEVIEKPAIFRAIPRRFKRYGMGLELFEKTVAGRGRYDVILITSGMTYWYPACIDIIKILRKYFKSTPILLGGNYPNLCFEHARSSSGADVVYKGRDIKEILHLIAKVAGVCFDYSLIDEAHKPFPAYGLYKNLSYITLRTSSGCPFRCTYCGWYLLEDHFRQEEPDFVMAQIEYFHRNLGVKNFSFYDDALLYNAGNHIVKILKGLMEKGLHLFFHTPNGLHNRFITPEIASLFKRANFIKPRLALETSSARRQSETGQKTTNEDFLNAVSCLKTAGYESKDISVYILIGLPGQELDEVRKSVEFAAGERVRIFLEEYSPIPGTPEYERSGLDPGADPLLHNNSAFPLYNPKEYAKLQDLKTCVHDINRAISADL